MAVAQPSGQGPSAVPSGEAVIQGTVLDSFGKPVAGAAVRIEKSRESAREATTDAAGVFTLHTLTIGAYTLTAEKSGLMSKPRMVSLVAAAEHKRVNLVIEGSDATSGRSRRSKSPPTSSMEFADQPHFTVAGVTDWTAAGGHGSDASLRASEALARATMNLKSAGTESDTGESTLSPTAQATTERELQAQLAAAPGAYAPTRTLGLFYLHAGKYSAAVPLLKTLWQIDTANYENEYLLALALKGAGDVAASQQHVEQMLAHHETADLHRLAGELNEIAGEPLSAVHQFEQATRLDPSELNYFEWGSELLLHRAVLQAEDIFRAGAKSFPRSARLQTALGSALFAAAKYDEAAQRLCDASDLSPNNSDPYMFMGKVQAAAPNALRCIESRLRRFAESEPDNSMATYYYALAVWKNRPQPEDRRAWEKAVALLKRAVTNDDRCADAYLQLGILYSLQNEPAQAIDFYSRAIESNPELAEAHYRLAVAYDRTSQPAKAAQEFKLHDELKKRQAAEVERQRREVKQFWVVGQPTYPVAH